MWKFWQHVPDNRQHVLDLYQHYNVQHGLLISHDENEMTVSDIAVCFYNGIYCRGR